MDNAVVILKMSRQRALELGLLTCECGHPSNNHFSWGAQTCAHCKCTGYREKGRAGTELVSEKSKRCRK